MRLQLIFRVHCKKTQSANSGLITNQSTKQFLETKVNFKLIFFFLFNIINQNKIIKNQRIIFKNF